MIIKSAYASNHELIKRIEQSNGQYLYDVQKFIEATEKSLLIKKFHSTNPYLCPGESINQNGMFTEFKPYLCKDFILFNDNHIENRGLHPEQKNEPNMDVLICKLKRFDFENALRDVENWRLERLTDVLCDLPVF